MVCRLLILALLLSGPLALSQARDQSAPQDADILDLFIEAPLPPDVTMLFLEELLPAEPPEENTKLEPKNLPLHLKEKLEKAPPQERDLFFRNFERWSQLSDVQKKALRERMQQEREQIRQEVQKALRGLDFKLDPDREDVFRLRYMQERRKIERELQQEIRQKRERKMKATLEDLEAEFAPFAKDKE